MLEQWCVSFLGPGREPGAMGMLGRRKVIRGSRAQSGTELVPGDPVTQRV